MIALCTAPGNRNESPRCCSKHCHKGVIPHRQACRTRKLNKTIIDDAAYDSRANRKTQSWHGPYIPKNPRTLPSVDITFIRITLSGTIFHHRAGVRLGR